MLVLFDKSVVVGDKVDDDENNGVCVVVVLLKFIKFEYELEVGSSVLFCELAVLFIAFELDLVERRTGVLPLWLVGELWFDDMLLAGVNDDVYT